MTRRRATEAVVVMAVAGSLWGSSFALVELISGTNPMLITGMRFGLYGVVSAVALLVLGGTAGIDWRVAFFHAATGYVGMYLCEVTAIQLAGPGPTIAVIGSIPVVYAVIGARRDGIAFARLAPSTAVLAVALVILNAEAFSDPEHSALSVLAGLAIAVAGVASWCVYALHNTDYLVRSPHVGAAQWSSAVGVAAGVLSLPLVLIGAGGSIDSASLVVPVVVYLAIGPSWIATMLWNRASVRVPRALAGQLIVFEAISAFALVHLLDGHGPSMVELTGEVLLVVGTIVALRRLGRFAAPTATSVADGGEHPVGQRY